MSGTSAPMLDGVTITESRPNDVLAALHESAHAEREYLFANREAAAGDLILVGWLHGEAIGYIAATDERANGMLIWEHLVVPAHRGQGLGQRLLREAAKRAVPGAVVVVDPFGELDVERIADYYRRLGFDHNAADGGIWATASDVLRATRPPAERGDEHDTPVKTLLTAKAPGVVTIAPQATVAAAVALLNQARVGALVVSSDGSRVEGICSERDILIALDHDGARALDRAVSEITTTDVVTCTAQETVSAAMELMTRNRVRHIPITETGRLIGLISMGDVVFNRLTELNATERS